MGIRRKAYYLVTPPSRSLGQAELEGTRPRNIGILLAEGSSHEPLEYVSDTVRIHSLTSIPVAQHSHDLYLAMLPVSPDTGPEGIRGTSGVEPQTRDGWLRN